MRKASVFWLSTTEAEIHFVDAIVTAYDGLANVRRDYRLHEGRTYFKIYVAPGMEAEFLELIRRLRGVAAIGELIEGDEDEAVSTL